MSSELSNTVAVSGFAAIFGPAMGRAKSWIKAEHLVLAKAYIHASETGSATCGADQTSDSFWLKVKSEIELRAPPGAEAYGRYHFRGINAISGHFRDKVAHDIHKFNKALRLVYSCTPTGVIQPQMVNMAVAIHLGRTGRMEYQFKDYDPIEWMNYRAWLVLKKHPKFLPPARPRTDSQQQQEAVTQDAPLVGEDDDSSEESTSEEATRQNLASRFEVRGDSAGNSRRNSEEEDELQPSSLYFNQDVPAERNTNYVPALPNIAPNAMSESLLQARRVNKNSAPTPRAVEVLPPSSSSTAAKKRGGHKGRTAAKAQVAVDEHRRKKMKTLAELTLIQKQRQESNERFQKFQMLKWQFDMETNPETKGTLSAAMTNILAECNCFGEEPLLAQHAATNNGDSDEDSDEE